jgi:hypothetical protein
VSGLQFIVDLFDALAWPAAIVVVVVFLRRPLADILTQVAHGLRRLRAGQSDAEFDRVASQAKAELTATVSGGAPGPEAVPALLRFAALADDNPSAAFSQALGAVEAAMRELLGSSGKLVPVGTGDPAAVARFARDQGLAPESLVRAVDNVTTLRNIAVADPVRATREHAVTYLALVDALLFAIAAQRDRAITAQPRMA